MSETNQPRGREFQLPEDFLSMPIKLIEPVEVTVDDGKGGEITFTDYSAYQEWRHGRAQDAQEEEQ